MEKLLIMGGGEAQVPLILKAQEMGFHAVVASIEGPYPGLALADSVAVVDLRDAQAVADAAERIGVMAIAGCGNDMSLPAQAAACERLGLPGLSPFAAQCSVNKATMKQAFEKAGVRTAPYRMLRSEGDLENAIGALGFPIVIKAVDLTGSAGVSIAHDREQALEAFRESMELTGEDYCLAEGFIEGQNLGAEVLVQGGRVLFTLPDGTISHQGRTNIPMGHFVPLDRPEADQEAIRAEACKAVAACGCDDCAVNLDLIWHDGKPYVVELSARAGTTCLPELTGLYFGIDYYEAILMTALGRDVSALLGDFDAAGQPAAAQMLAAPATGVVGKLSLPDELPSYVEDLHFIVKPGDAVHAFESCRDRIGQVIVTGDDVAECLERIGECLACAAVEVDAG